MAWPLSCPLHYTAKLKKKKKAWQKDLIAIYRVKTPKKGPTRLGEREN